METQQISQGLQLVFVAVAGMARPSRFSPHSCRTFRSQSRSFSSSFAKAPRAQEVLCCTRGDPPRWCQERLQGARFAGSCNPYTRGWSFSLKCDDFTRPGQTTNHNSGCNNVSWKRLIKPHTANVQRESDDAGWCRNGVHHDDRVLGLRSCLLVRHDSAPWLTRS